MANMKEVKNRIKSIENTKQITNAMQLVSFSKLKKAKDRAQKTRPFFDALYSTMTEIAQTNNDFTSVFTQSRSENKSLFIIIGGDRGLAGGYNNNVFKHADALMSGKTESKVIAIGKKACEYYKRKKDVEIIKEYVNIAEHITIRQANDIGKIAIDAYEKGEVENVYIVFTQFVSMLTQEPMSVKMLPVDVKGDDGVNTKKQIVTYDPSPTAVFNCIVPEYLCGIIYSAAVESFASEQGARRMAMENATDNATDMIADLRLLYNRARQSAITQEITEIISGANAL